MARRKRSRKAAPEPPAEASAQLPMFEAPSGVAELRVLPHELLPGDVVRDALGDGTVIHVPALYRQGKRVSVRLRLSSGEERVIDLAAHEKVPVRRLGESPTDT